MPDSPTDPVEPEPEPDDLEQALTAAFGEVDNWFPAHLPGIGPIQLPLPASPE